MVLYVVWVDGDGWAAVQDSQLPISPIIVEGGQQKNPTHTHTKYARQVPADALGAAAAADSLVLAPDWLGRPRPPQR